MDEATVSEQWSYKLPLEVELVQGRGSGSVGTGNAIEQQMFCFLGPSISVPFASPSFFLFARFIQLPYPAFDENDVADLILEHLLLTEHEYADEPVVIAKNLTLKYLFR